MLIDILKIIFNYLNIKLKVMELFSYSDLLIPGVVASQFLVVLLMVYTFRNLLGLLESAIMLQTSMLEINV